MVSSNFQSLPPLDDLLDYSNEIVIQRYSIENPTVAHADAEQLFTDLLAWMWLCLARKQQELTTHLIQPLNHLDAMWHLFILHTRDYNAFCQRYFGAYFHHDHSTLNNEYELSQQELIEYLTSCYDFLGEAWVLRNLGNLL
jgi:hypothetical protein